jgi:SAM-dependent methyltransferase
MNHTGSSDAATLKQFVRQHWDRDAGGWNEFTPQIRAWLREATDAMLALADIREGSRVLDIAAGAGDQTLDIAKRVGPSGAVLATDLSPVILAYAKANAEAAGYKNIEIKAADGEDLGVVDASFDAAICRLGLMFFPNPLQGLREVHRALRPGGRFCTLVFSTPEANPCVGILLRTALQHAGLPPRHPYQPGALLSLGKPGLMDDLFRQAGFAGVATSKIAAPFRLPSARDYLDFIRSSASPILGILKKTSWQPSPRPPGGKDQTNCFSPQDTGGERRRRCRRGGRTRSSADGTAAWVRSGPSETVRLKSVKRSKADSGDRVVYVS